MIRLAACLVPVLLLSGFAGPAAQEPGRRRGFSITITEPANQEIVFGKMRIAATVKSEQADAVDRVEFAVGERVVFVDREAPYELLHDFGQESKSWVVRATAHHREGVTVSDTVVTRRVPFIEVARVNRVLLWVTATGPDDWPVTDMTVEEFEVEEEGRPQRVLEFSREDRPITLALLLDSSGSMQEEIKDAHAAAAGFVDSLRPEDRALVIDFDDRVFLIQDLTADAARLKQAIESTEAIGGTALYDALHAAYRKIGRLDGRKAIVLLSDGEDSASQTKLERLLEEARANNTLIYSIALGMGDRGPLKQLAEVTGGRFFAVSRASELDRAYQRIADELHAQYFLSYETSNTTWDGRFVAVKVDSKRPGVKVRARTGYQAVRSDAQESSAP